MDMIKEERDADMLSHTMSSLNEENPIGIENNRLSAVSACNIRKNEAKVSHVIHFIVCE
jgi:hypothetical protein